VSAPLVEAGCALRRLARRRTAPATLLVGAVLLGYAAAVRPVATARDALSASSAIGAVVVLFLSAGIVADDRERGRLALAATHPSPPAVWVVGRWLAVAAAAVAVFAVATAVLLEVARAPEPPVGVALAAAAALAHLVALAALAVALSCSVGSTAQVLVLLAVLGLGAVPPEIAAQALGAAAGAVARVAWAVLPTSWALSRLHEWALAAGPPAPALALGLALQPALWLGAGVRRLAGSELAARSG